MFVTKSNYAEYLKQTGIEAKRKSAQFDSTIASLKHKIANKTKLYDETKDLVRKNPDLKEHYNLDKHLKEIEKLKTDYRRATKQKDNIKAAIPTFEKYLKLLETTPVILGTILEPVQKGTFKGSKVVYKLNEPWKGFVDSVNFVRGALDALTFQHLLRCLDKLRERGNDIVN